MSEETKQNAIDKLDAITIYVGSADVDYYDYSTINPDADMDLFTNTIAIDNELYRQQLAKAGTSTDKDAWGYKLPANEINGHYDPATNSVYVTAAILDAPYYSSDYSDAQNYGGIGYLIGHEMTHAFDSTGGLYDKDGNLSDWWTEEDKETFAELTSKVSERYSSYATVDDQHVDGDLTLDETVADLGGIKCALDAMKSAYSDDPDQTDYEEFFDQYASTWAIVLTKDYAQTLLQSDHHAPNCLRANINATQCDEFYDAFEVGEGDMMYTNPEERRSVW